MGALGMYAKGAVLMALGIIIGVVGFLIGLEGVVYQTNNACLIGIIIIVIALIIYKIGKFYSNVAKNTTPVIFYNGDGRKEKRVKHTRSLPPPPPPPPPPMPELPRTSYYERRERDIISTYHPVKVEEEKQNEEKISHQEFLEKLEILKKARDTGLISDEDFEEKKRELLRRL